jgi:hypothetical protein
MQKPLTKQELEALPWPGDADKQRIEDTIEAGIGDVDDIQSRCLRGYLASLLTDVMPSDAIRAELGVSAACYCDGWRDCLKYEARRKPKPPGTLCKSCGAYARCDMRDASEHCTAFEKI